MTNYRVGTDYGNKYLLDKDGYVLEYSNGLKKDADSESRKTWQITGAWYFTGFGNTRTISLEELIKRNNLRLRNGKARYGLTDIDHGTRRMHGNKECHGINFISKH